MRNRPASLTERFISLFLIQYPLLSSHSQNGLAVRTQWRLCWGGSTHTHKHTHTLSDQSNQRNAASCATSQLDWQWALAVSFHRGGWKEVDSSETQKERLELRKGEALQQGLAWETASVHCWSRRRRWRKKKVRRRLEKHSACHTCDQLWSAKLVLLKEKKKAWNNS